MKNLPLLFVLLGVLGTSALAQRAQPAPTMLLGPADWRFERLPIPPAFAPNISWSGYEEARFSPGMFSTNSPTYFTYALSICIDGTPKLQEKKLEEFLEKYYKGLSKMVGESGKNKKPKTDVIKAEVKPRKDAAGTAGLFTARMPFIDTFTDARQILLNLEIDVRPLPEVKKTHIILLISPLGMDAEIWKQLRSIRDAARAPEADGKNDKKKPVE